MKVSAWIRQVSDRLSDQEPDFEFETWTETQLLDSLNSALRALTSFKPESFSKTITLDINEGDIVESGCEKLLSIVGLYRRNGAFEEALPNLGTVNNAVYKRRQRLNCKGTDASKPIAADIISDTEIRIFPTQTEPSDYKIKAQCLTVPQVASLEDDLPLPLHISEAFQEFMLYYLYDIDNESVPNRERSGVHWTNAFTLLGLSNDRTPRR